MDNFKAVYRILSALEKAMDLPQFDIEQIGPAALGVSQERWCRYITGETAVDARNMRITLKGLEYLQENSIMQKLYKAAKGLADVVP